MVAAGRPMRTRRRRMVVAGAVLCALVAVAATLIVSNSRDETTTAKTQVEIYRSTIPTIVSMAMPAATVTEIAVLDHLCANVLRPDAPCETEPLPLPVRQGIAKLEHPRIQFVSSADGVRTGRLLITLGPITFVQADLAEFSASFRQAPNYDGSETYRVRLDGDEWRRVTP